METDYGRVVVHIDPDIEDLIPGFLENRQKDITTVTEALRTEDYETIQRMGHTMKGAGGGYGFDEITDIGSRMEAAAQDKDNDAILRQVRALSDYLEHVVIVYDE